MRTPLHDSVFPFVLNTELDSESARLCGSCARLIRARSQTTRFPQDKRKDFLFVQFASPDFGNVLTAVVLEYITILPHIAEALPTPLCRALSLVPILHFSNLTCLPTTAQSPISLDPQTPSSSSSETSIATSLSTWTIHFQ